MLERLMIRMKVGQRLEHIDLPEAEALGKMAIRPALRRPDFSHGGLTLAKVVMDIDEEKVSVVERMHESGGHVEDKLLHRPIWLRAGVCLLIVRRGAERLRGTDDKHRLLRVVASREHLALFPLVRRVIPLVPIVLAAALLGAHLVLLAVAELAQERVLWVVLVRGLDLHDGVNAQREQLQDTRHRAEPAIGDEDAPLVGKALDHADRERNRTPRSLSSKPRLELGTVLLLLHGLLALVHFEEEKNAADPATQRVQLEPLWGWLALHVHKSRHASPHPADHAFVEAHDVAALHGCEEGVAQRVPETTGRVERII
mmetsp:Transcript_8430/g.17059  ORF Transcript_8430/g.17059 Transcript_8430/m.17059 type:complete len:314 (+) Transcript_8430:752-1693(+)